MTIEITNAPRVLGLSRSLIQRALQNVLESEGQGERIVCVCFVMDARMRALHRQYKGVDRSTDVLAFGMQEGVGRGISPEVLGDIVVSSETAAREARARRLPVRRELLLYAVHGVLHLLGYRDGTARDARVMHRLERAYLRAVAPRSRAARARRS